MKFKEVKLYNPGILCGDMPEETFTELLESCEQQILNKSVNAALKRNMVVDYTVQGIEETIFASIPKSYNEYLCNLSIEYCNYFDFGSTTNLQPKVLNSWLNLQKKHEYRPLHHHSDNSGNQLSFVTYIKIPYTLKDEDSHSNYNQKALVFRNGRIEFLYATYSGKQITKTVDIDQTYEGKTLIFHNSFMHMVYPFYTSDEYRISLAGNIII